MGGRGGQRGQSGLILGPDVPSRADRAAGRGAPPKLIIPGQQFKKPQPSRPNADLVLPAEDGTIAAPPVTTQYRPPAGFMDDVPQDYGMGSMDPEEGLNKLRSRSGHWHNLAKVIVTLYRKGLDSTMLDDLTGIPPIEQSRWIVAGTVYDTLVADGSLPASVLQHFDHNGEKLLPPFRYLGVERRVAAAKYIVENDLSETECGVLARAMKEWERRPLERDGFDDGPADCLAFKYLRDAIEAREEELRNAKIEQGLKVASSQSARERLLELRDEPEEDPAQSMAMLTVCRLNAEELGFRPLPQISPLGTATAAEVASAPTTSQEGAFGAFSISRGNLQTKWVALPQWKALQLARHPVALPVSNCMADPAIVAASRVKTDEDKRRMAGSGLLVVDAATPDALDDASFYLVAGSGDGPVTLVQGVQLKGQQPMATVLFLARPPSRESVMSQTAEVLQV